MSALWKRGTEAAGASGAGRTTQTYILGVGASGALLAGAGVALISLVGLVSFDVWPGAPMGGGSQEEAQLNFDRSTEQPAAAAGLGPAAGILTPTATTLTTGGAPGGADDGGAKRSPKPPKSPKSPAGNAPAAPPAPGPGIGDGVGSGGGSGGPGNGNQGSGSGGPGTGNQGSGSGGPGKGNSGGNKASVVTSESTVSAPGKSGSNSSSKPGLGRGR